MVRAPVGLKPPCARSVGILWGRKRRSQRTMGLECRGRMNFGIALKAGLAKEMIMGIVNGQCTMFVGRFIRSYSYISFPGYDTSIPHPPICFLFSLFQHPCPVPELFPFVAVIQHPTKHDGDDDVYGYSSPRCDNTYACTPGPSHESHRSTP